MKIPNPDGTCRPCRQRCGGMTVLAELVPGGGMVRVHCGTYRAACPRPVRRAS